MSDWNNIQWNLRYHWKAGLIWGLAIGTFGVFALCSPTEKVGAWVSAPTYQPFPEGEATVINHRFRFSDEYSLEWWEWETGLIPDALGKWNDAGSGFRFHTRAALDTDDPCNLSSGEVAIIWSDGHRVCPGDPPLPPTGGVAGLTPALIGQNAARIYMYAEPGTPAQVLRLIVPTILLHEFGHVLGLGHPDEAGQSVDAIMNSGFGPDVFAAELLPDDIAGVRALYGEKEPLIGFLENPGDGSYGSGIGIISGWVCDAEEIEIEIITSGGTVELHEAAYGTERLDTEGECGDADNGFGLLFNWNRLGNGVQTVRVLVDGVELGRAKVEVATLGEEFLRGKSGRYTLDGFPDPNYSTVIEWSESQQNFVILGKRRKQ